MDQGCRNTCEECSKQYRKKLKPDEIDRNVDRHNKKILTVALSKMPYKDGVGYDIDARQDIRWGMHFSTYDLIFRVVDSQGSINARKSYRAEMPTKQKIQSIVDFLRGYSIRLELSPFDREMAKRVIYIY